MTRGARGNHGARAHSDVRGIRGGICGGIWGAMVSDEYAPEVTAVVRVLHVHVDLDVCTRDDDMVNWIRKPSGLMEEILHFDTNGKGREDEGTYECGPWELVDMPFEGGTAESDQASDWIERTKSKEKL